MAKLFTALLVLLTAASLLTAVLTHRQLSDVPVIVWQTDPDPLRQAQADLFRVWQKEHNFVLRDRQGRVRTYSQREAERLNAFYGFTGREPAAFRAGDPKTRCLVKLDFSGRQSLLLQAASGCAPDLFDNADVAGFASLGVLRDVTNEAKVRGFGLDRVFPGVRTLLTRNGRQYAYPSCGSIRGMWVDLAALKKVKLPPPPEFWTPETFAALGREYVRRANQDAAGEPLEVQQRFWAPSAAELFPALAPPLLRSMGQDLWNETLTACTADTPEMRLIFRLLHQWTYMDHLLPTAAEAAASLNGRCAVILSDRYPAADLRQEQGPPPAFLLTDMPQQEGFRSAVITVRAANAYRGSRHPEEVLLFLEFLASPEYGRFLLEHSGGLPGNPAAVEPLLPELIRRRPQEGQAYRRTFECARSEALPAWEANPFLPVGTPDWLTLALSRSFNGLCTVEEAVREAAQHYDEAIRSACRSNPGVRAEWQRRIRDQQEIDRCRKAHRPIPAELVRNPFHRRYYAEKKMLQVKP